MRWRNRVWADVVIGPYGVSGGAEEARTCTANRLTARIPHPSLRDTFPPGEGQVRTASGHLGCGGGTEIWADVVIGPYGVSGAAVVVEGAP